MADAYQDRQAYGENLRVKDIEEKQNIIKDRLLLIGQNLLDFKDETSEKILEMKGEIESMKDNIERMKSFFEAFSGEIEKFARKDDLEILRKQAKMFQPLEFVRKSELRDLMK